MNEPTIPEDRPQDLVEQERVNKMLRYQRTARNGSIETMDQVRDAALTEELDKLHQLRFTPWESHRTTVEQTTEEIRQQTRLSMLHTLHRMTSKALAEARAGTENK